MTASRPSAVWRPGGDVRLSISLSQHLPLESRGSALRQRCRFGGWIFFRYLVVNLFGLVGLLLRLVESGQFELRRRLADDERRLVDQLLIKIDRLRVLIFRG